jgi:hypothetical protein
MDNEDMTENIEDVKIDKIYMFKNKEVDPNLSLFQLFYLGIEKNYEFKQNNIHTILNCKNEIKCYNEKKDMGDVKIIEEIDDVFNISSINSTENKAIEILDILKIMNKAMKENNDFEMNMTNSKISSKIKKQISNTFLLYSELLPTWCMEMIKNYDFLFSFEDKKYILNVLNFGVGRSLIKIQENSNIQNFLKKKIKMNISKFEVDREKIFENGYKILNNFQHFSKNIFEFIFKGKLINKIR